MTNVSIILLNDVVQAKKKELERFSESVLEGDLS